MRSGEPPHPVAMYVAFILEPMEKRESEVDDVMKERKGETDDEAFNVCMFPISVVMCCVAWELEL